MKIEYVGVHDIVACAIDVAAYGEQPVPVVRLAEVDAVLKEAVKMAEWIRDRPELGIEIWKPAYELLCSPDVAAWRERHEVKL